MNKLLSKTGCFFKKNVATILTGIGTAGVVITAVSAIKATPKALYSIEEAEKEKASEGACHLADGYSVSGRALFLPVLHAEQLCQALAHDLHSDGHVHHAPPVDGDVSAA